MGALLDRDSIVRGLVAAGVPREKAEQQADREYSALPPVQWRAKNPIEPKGARRELVVVEEIAKPPIAWPVRLLLPWSFLVSDNERKEPYIAHVDGKPVARMRLSKRYAAAMAKIANVARNTIGDAAPVAIPLAIRALVWVPGGSTRNDIANFEKLAHDALEGVVYTNDNLLHDIHWTRAGRDIDAPRAEITITPLSP